MDNRYVRFVMAQRTCAQRRGENKRREEPAAPRATPANETSPRATVKLARARRHGARSRRASEATRAGLLLLVCVLGRHPPPPSSAPCNHHPAPPPPPHRHHDEHSLLASLLLTHVQSQLRQAGALAQARRAFWARIGRNTRGLAPSRLCVLGRRPSPPSPAPCNHHPAPPPPLHCHHGEHAFLASIRLCSHPPRLLPPSSSYMRSIYLPRLLIPFHPALATAMHSLPLDAPLPPTPISLSASFSPFFSRLAYNPFRFSASFSTVFSSSVLFSVTLCTLPRIPPFTPSPHFLHAKFRRSRLVAYSPIMLRREKIGKDHLCQRSWWCRSWSCLWRS